MSFVTAASTGQHDTGEGVCGSRVSTARAWALPTSSPQRFERSTHENRAYRTTRRVHCRYDQLYNRIALDIEITWIMYK